MLRRKVDHDITEKVTEGSTSNMSKILMWKIVLKKNKEVCELLLTNPIDIPFVRLNHLGVGAQYRIPARIFKFMSAIHIVIYQFGVITTCLCY